MVIAALALAAARAEFSPAGSSSEVGFDPFLKMLKRLRDSGHYASLFSLSTSSFFSSSSSQ